MLENMYEAVPMCKILEKDETALCVEGEDVLGITDSSITILMESLGWELFFCHSRTEEAGNGSVQIFTEVYKDRRGNSIFIEYKPAVISLNLKEMGKLELVGFKMNPYGFLVEKRMITRIDLREFINTYHKNDFDNALYKIGKYLIRKCESSLEYIK